MYGVVNQAVSNLVRSDNPEQAKAFWAKAAAFVDKVLAGFARRYPAEVRKAVTWAKRRLMISRSWR